MPTTECFECLSFLLAVSGHEADSITYHLDFDELVNLAWLLDETLWTLLRQEDVQRWMIVDLQDPDLQVLVDEDVKPKYLETVPLRLVELATELSLLLYYLVWLQRQERPVADLADLLK